MMPFWDAASDSELVLTLGDNANRSSVGEYEKMTYTTFP
jgi:hypothetical protein